VIGCVCVCVCVCVCAASSSCYAGAWSSPPIVCGSYCPALQQPQNSAFCVKTLHSYDFSSPGISDQLTLHPAVPSVYTSLYFSVSGGVLVTNAGDNCKVIQSPLSPMLLYVAQPYWSTMTTTTQWNSMLLRVTLSITSGACERIRRGCCYCGAGDGSAPCVLCDRLDGCRVSRARHVKLLPMWTLPRKPWLLALCALVLHIHH
jgi:hypothetical protein